MTKTRFRTDSPFAADDAARILRGEEPRWFEREELAGVEAARPGDTWRARWYGTDAIAGYDICCTKCGQVHAWTTALNRSSRRPLPDGGATCDHSGVGSCWSWSGSAEEGTLTASPSLHCQADHGGCGFHGWLQNGVLSDC